ncbi:unnamed protein product [Lepeophtheirus salmonis]|uniref:(salmon louse) hypothetical protein n=1 Tax=Lepeophtheirus salmonis TaxID=72036 RepID=A0A7R8CS78_LEPSM|nr:unnamed protein product [Lepeophtheirus salmonis]CAF2914372.1 unnamed protein product [Lepeophtheirus salmonis]
MKLLLFHYCGNVGIDQYDKTVMLDFRTSTFGMAYDYGSIMHYGLTYFSTNGQNTISLKKSTTARIPNRSGMSDLDVQKRPKQPMNAKMLSQLKLLLHLQNPQLHL